MSGPGNLLFVILTWVWKWAWPHSSSKSRPPPEMPNLSRGAHSGRGFSVLGWAASQRKLSAPASEGRGRNRNDHSSVLSPRGYFSGRQAAPSPPLKKRHSTGVMQVVFSRSPVASCGRVAGFINYGQILHQRESAPDFFFLKRKPSKWHIRLFHIRD